ncbi:MAG: magnesium/cobalt transporter CorA [Actinobacteria bacterium]|nr:magnesium/cobalt transporter CorA [Actinomycetota bacterium]MBL7060998.1 magnesium/cobalt transporter CorA [Actinomycetota bacterium]
MVRFIKKRSKKAGLPPGSLVHIGKKGKAKTKITVIDYDKKSFQELEIEDLKECILYKNKPTITWINVDGIENTKLLKDLGECFSIHLLTLEDILNTDQRPKLEDFENYIYIVLKMLSYDEKEDEISSEQVSLILGKNYVISLQESEGDIFDPIRERIKNGKGRVRKVGSDYLSYLLLDAIVDNYFTILEKISEKIEGLEDEIIKSPTQETLNTIHNLKTEMLYLKKSVWPLREVVNKLERGELSLIKKTTSVYLRDIYDHTIQVIDTVETLRDMLSGMLDIYLSSVSNRMNEVMKVLTIIATIFIPLSFIAGIYGMNFSNMPELGWPWSYIVFWIVVLIIGVTMIIYFKRKKWL